MVANDPIADELLRATTTVGEHYYAAAAGVGLTVQEARLLFILGLEPTNMLGLTSALRVPKSTMTGLVARLEAAGLITRERDAADHRHLVSTPTREGRDAAARFARDLAKSVDGVLSPLDHAGQRELAGILSELLAGIED
jgi:DNA-binding MarR family transcriptional regulator